MRKSTKILTGVISALIVGGLVLMGIGYMNGADPVKMYEDNKEMLSFTIEDDEILNEHNENNSYTVPVDGINSIEIDWVSGNVEISPYDGDEILIEERSTEVITKKYSLGYKIEEGELEIEYLRNNIVGVNVKGPDKDLVIKVPETLAASMHEISCSTVSADIFVGDFVLAELDLETVSGNIEAELTTLPAQTGAETTSGEININIPETAEFRGSFETVSGEMASEFSLKSSGINFIHGHGISLIEVETVSGNFNLVYRK